MIYDDRWTLGQARRLHFERSKLGDGGYERRWFALHIGRFSLYLPNTRARVRAVKLHDLHHVLTEYETTWAGEVAIAGWEIGSGCGRYSAAWVLNLGGMGAGLIIAPATVYRAFVRGRHSGNLYPGEFQESMLDRSVGDLRHELRLDRAPPPAGPADRIGFALWSAPALIIFLLPALLIIALVLLFRQSTPPGVP